jgi:hypothetical protein
LPALSVDAIFRRQEVIEAVEVGAYAGLFVGEDDIVYLRARIKKRDVEP